MKRSELIMTGEIYRLTPYNWGETSIMIDEDAVAQCYADAAGVSVDEFDPDGDQNNKPESVEIATDGDGNFYAILEPFEKTSWGHKTGEMCNENMYMKCQDPSEVDDDGAVLLYSNKWQIFDEDE